MCLPLSERQENMLLFQLHRPPDHQENILRSLPGTKREQTEEKLAPSSDDGLVSWNGALLLWVSHQPWLKRWEKKRKGKKKKRATTKREPKMVWTRYSRDLAFYEAETSWVPKKLYWWVTSPGGFATAQYFMPPRGVPNTMWVKCALVLASAGNGGG